MTVRREPRSATYEAPPNIALVKYWGVRDEERALPFNSSLSVTLEGLRSRTTVQLVPGLERDRLRLNGTTAPERQRMAVSRFLDRVRSAAGNGWHADVRSKNNFPTASGLASSASGFAALAGAASTASGLRLSPRALSQLARFGSGSASRSIFGGFVEWRRGERKDGQDCYARPLFPANHWPELVDLVCLVARAPVKTIRSATAMQQSVATSPEFQGRQREVPRRIEQMIRAVRAKEAAVLFPLIMEECDSFRLVCESTRPTLDYLTGTSRMILETVRAENEELGPGWAAYTHDAGAHVHVFTLMAHAPALRRRLSRIRGVSEVRPLRPGPGARRLPNRLAV